MKLFYILIFLFSAQLLFSQTNDTITTKSGLKYFFTKRGEGKAVDSGTVVIQHYTVWLSNGDKIDSSRDRNEPFGFEHPSNNLINGTNEALSLMRVGDRGIFIMPYYLAYGEKGRESVIPPKETLIFDIEVLDIKESSVRKELLDVLYDESFQVDSIPKTKETFVKYKYLKQEGFKDLYVSENDFNLIGYDLLEKFPRDALEFFKQNVIEYPNSSNVYDSLGECYMVLGENKLAILNYKKSLELDPENKSAVKMLEKLKDL